MKNRPLPPRELHTPVGVVRYADSGWTEQQWDAIADAMSRCEGIFHQ